MAKSRGKLTGWMDAFFDASIVAGCGGALVYLNGDTMIADTLIQHVLPKGVISQGLLRPIIFGVTVGTVVFIVDLVMMYKNDYHR